MAFLIYHPKTLKDDITNGKVFHEGASALVLAIAAAVFIFVKRDVLFSYDFMLVLSIILTVEILWLAWEGFWLVKEAVDFYMLQHALVIKSSNEAINLLRESGIGAAGNQIGLIQFEGSFYWYIDNKYAVSISAYIYGEEVSPDTVEKVGIDEQLYINNHIYTLKYYAGCLYLE
jgi:hypothetical protein